MSFVVAMMLIIIFMHTFTYIFPQASKHSTRHAHSWQYSCFNVNCPYQEKQSVHINHVCGDLRLGCKYLIPKPSSLSLYNYISNFRVQVLFVLRLSAIKWLSLADEDVLLPPGTSNSNQTLIVSTNEDEQDTHKVSHSAPPSRNNALGAVLMLGPPSHFVLVILRHVTKHFCQSK